MISALILALLQVADAVTTLKVLALGGREMNPVMAKLFDRFGAKPVLVLKAAAVSAVGLWLTDYPAVIGLVIAFYVVVVANNLIALKDG